MKRIGVYVGIPFCPTRCAYCSFPSNARDDRAVESYLTALFSEVEAVGKMIRQKSLAVETVYIGGGTPTALTEEELDRLLTHLEKWIDMSRCIEFTVEAGRPDTITAGKLNVIKSHGAGRISINPQTMKQETLDIIGRHHTVQEVRKAMARANQSGIPIVNMDMIAGLPGESADDFERSLRQIVEEGPQNVTVHTLAIKKASRFKEEQPNAIPAAREVEKMVRMSREILKEAGYRPYYLYRQKYMAGNFENVGYALPGTEGGYNIRIMAEKQTILAMGAGGISKFYFPKENRLERVANVSNYEIYVQRIDEMIRRKRDFFEKW